MTKKETAEALRWAALGKPEWKLQLIAAALASERNARLKAGEEVDREKAQRWEMEKERGEMNAALKEEMARAEKAEKGIAALRVVTAEGAASHVASALAAALEEAARSLEAIARVVLLPGIAVFKTIDDVRPFARSRACVARAALEKKP